MLKFSPISTSPFLGKIKASDICNSSTSFNLSCFVFKSILAELLVTLQFENKSSLGKKDGAMSNVFLL